MLVTEYLRDCRARFAAPRAEVFDVIARRQLERAALRRRFEVEADQRDRGAEVVSSAALAAEVRRVVSGPCVQADAAYRGDDFVHLGPPVIGNMETTLNPQCDSQKDSR